ncbi:hypothetical protein NQZ68_023796 [Dissostichus eleginoides]|nr:hypothetical protein NQZ68_023796 [Dissostichus eleginoides]
MKGLDGIMGRDLDGCEKTLAVCCNALWVGTHTSVLSNPEAALWFLNKQARPLGPRRSGPTAPVGRAQNTISSPDNLILKAFSVVR